MFGVFYFFVTLFSKIGQGIVEWTHDFSNRCDAIDEGKNLYVDYNGGFRDVNTDEITIPGKDRNGHKVYFDRYNNVVRDFTVEKWEREMNEMRCSRKGQKAYDTRTYEELRFGKGKWYPKLYLDLKTNEKLAVVKKNVYWRHKVSGEIFQIGQKIYNFVGMKPYLELVNKEFYVKWDDPEILLCLSDEQMERENGCKEYSRYNWVDDENARNKFIERHNDKVREHPGKSILLFKEAGR